MPALIRGDELILDEPGLYDDTGVATSFFYYRTCDQVSDLLLDAVDLGAEARRTINQSTYSATASIDVSDPVKKGDRLRYEVTVERIGGKSVGYRAKVLNAEDGHLHAVFDTVAVCMDMSGPTPKAIPDSVREKLEGFFA